MAETCPTCGGPRQSFYVAGYERAEAKQAGRVAELEAALRPLVERMSARRGVLAGADPDIARAQDALKGER